MTEEERVELQMRPATPRDTLTVVETIYHQSWGEGPTAYPTSFMRELSVQEQPYFRKIKVGERWQPLDLGWFKDRPQDVGMIQLVNDEGTFAQTQPTDEERAAADAKVIDVVTDIVDAGPLAGILAKDSFSWQIPPRESFRGNPTNAKQLWVRCRSGVARATVNVYPR